MFRNTVIYLFISFLVACGGDHETTSADSSEPGTDLLVATPDEAACGVDHETTSADSSEPGTASLVSAPDEVALLTLLKGAIRNTSNVSYYSTLTDGADVNFVTASATAEASSTTSVSSTNLQVSGVDEADLIKNDANHLFIAAPATTVYDYPIGVMETVATDMIYPDPITTANKIRILKMLTNPAATEVVTELEIGTVDDPPLTGLYMQTDSLGVAEKLITVSSSGGWQTGSSLIHIIDVSDPTMPVLEKRVEIDGKLIASRRIDNQLYLVTRYSPSIPGYIDYAYDLQTQDNNEQILSTVELSDLMPNIRYDDGISEELLNASDCYLTDGSDESSLHADLITLTVLDINTPATENSRCFIGATEAVFVSQNAAYLATSQHEYSVAVNGLLDYNAGYQTEIHKFRLKGATAIYSGSESVEGHLGWDRDKKSFRMGEQAEHLVVATSVVDSWSNTATTKLTVIKEDDQNGFTTINTLPNESHPEKIGKPGEKLYSVRFVDGLAYLVTFRVTDPLYVVDLTNPADPFIAGELQIDGYSDYLHPLPNGLLLGIGKDAVADSSGDDTRGAWYQGVKLSLFDVSDWSNPTELNSLVIGKRGSQSAALHDHHAVTILPGDGVSRATRIAIPIDMHDGISIYDYGSGEPWQWYDWTHTGLYLFDVDTNASNPQLMEAGKIIAEINDGTNNYYGSGNNDRSVLTEEAAYYVHDYRVWSAPLGLLE